MRRTKGWWAQLAAAERSLLVRLERARCAWGSVLEPSFCAICRNPTRYSGLCTNCDTKLNALIAKANDAMKTGG